MLQRGNLLDAIRRLAGNVQYIPLARHDARPAPYTFIAHRVERIGFKPRREDVVNHLLRRPIEYGTQ